MERKRGKILVIDDDGLVLQTARNLLVRDGYPTTSSPSGERALDLIEKEDFDLILCDIRMPQMNGIETAERIQHFLKAHGRERIPIVFFTGYADDKAYEKAKRLGDVLLKPYDIQELLTLVRRHVGSPTTK